MTSGQVHPLDVELADLVDGALDDPARGAEVEAHLDGCLLCRVKCQRLRAAPPAALDSGPGLDPLARLGLGLDLALPPGFSVPAPHDRRDPGAGELWLAGPDEDERVLVLVLAAVPPGDRVAVAPVTFDREAADDETVIVEAAGSTLGLDLAVYPALATELPRAALVSTLGSLTGPLQGAPGTPITGPTDPRLDVRQYLADRLGALEDTPPDPETAADAPAPALDHVRSQLVRDVRAWRGNGCAVRPLFGWQEVVVAHRVGWEALAVIDELGIVLVVFDTPHGLADDEDFDAARSVLTRFNATAVVVLARAVSELADVFDAPALNYGIETPSGARTPPRPLISGLAATDAIAKYLDQSTGARAMSMPSRRSVGRVDVADVLRNSATAAVADAVKQGGRFKIAPKRRAYESLADLGPDLGAALGRALASEPIVDDILGLARGDGR